jgi:hypothetical protein
MTDNEKLAAMARAAAAKIDDAMRILREWQKL